MCPSIHRWLGAPSSIPALHPRQPASCAGLLLRPWVFFPILTDFWESPLGTEAAASLQQLCPLRRSSCSTCTAAGRCCGDLPGCSPAPLHAGAGTFLAIPADIPFPKKKMIQKRRASNTPGIACLRRAGAVTPGSHAQLVPPPAFLLDLIHCSFTTVIILGKCNAGHRSPSEAANCCWNEAIRAVIERNAWILQPSSPQGDAAAETTWGKAPQPRARYPPPNCLVRSGGATEINFPFFYRGGGRTHSC